MTDQTHKTPQVPPGWASDPLSAFIQDAVENTYASFHNLKPLYERLKDIDASFRIITGNIDRTHDWFASFFLFRSHAAHLGGVRLALSGQVPETYILLRACLENSLYGLYVSRKPASQEIWLRRHDSDESKKKVKAEFTIRNLLAVLSGEDPELRRIAGNLYETTIDYGGHPNEPGLLSVLEQQEDESITTFRSAYLVGNGTPLHLSLKSCARVGVCSLSVFRRVYPERFDILGLTEDLRALEEGL
jgi:hypothetical protein